MNLPKFLSCFFLTGWFFCVAQRANAQDWQWAVAVKNSRARANPSQAFLWIPTDCRYVRGVVVAQHNMEEISILENPTFRKRMAELGFAEIWVSPSFDHLFHFNEGVGDTFNQLVADLAEVSGYKELTIAPVVGLGHSAAASWPYYFGVWNPERTLACLSVSGQWPYFRSPQFAPDIWGNRILDFVPCLETMGEYESANTWSTEGLNERQQHPLLPLSMLACPAEGHFATTDKKCEYLAFFIRKAAQYRLPANTPAGKAPTLKLIDPTKTGWLADKWREDQVPTAPAAPVGQYTGDVMQAFWFFDEETVRATEAYQSAYRHKKAELVGYQQQGTVVPQRNTHQQVDLTFTPQADGITFTLNGVFLDSVPGTSPRPAMWTGLPAGSPIGHATGGGAIAIHKITGPFQPLTDSTFILRLERGLGPHLKSYDLWFTATHPGDDVYKPAVQQAKMSVPLSHTTGVVQTITFPAIPDQKTSRKSLQLQATSDAGLPVSYYIVAGPASINGNTLTFHKLPPKSRFPVKVTIVAWQYGNASVKTAEPVEQTFLMTR